MSGLTGVLPDTAIAYTALDAYARSQGIAIAVADFGGIRTQSDTTKILGYRQDDFNAALNAGLIAPSTTLQQFRPIAPFGSSYHNYGAAFDIKVVAWPSSMTQYGALKLLGAHAPSLGLRWGGTFTNPDTPHFELAISLADAKQRYTSYASGGGASSSLSDIANAFDLGSFLPGLAPSTDDVAAAIDAPDYAYAGDDAGAGVVSADEQPPTSLLVLGLAVAGLVVWALRRKFT